jgi:hypothetical protein
MYMGESLRADFNEDLTIATPGLDTVTSHRFLKRSGPDVDAHKKVRDDLTELAKIARSMNTMIEFPANIFGTGINNYYGDMRIVPAIYRALLDGKFALDACKLVPTMSRVSAPVNVVTPGTLLSFIDKAFDAYRPRVSKECKIDDNLISTYYTSRR